MKRLLIILSIFFVIFSFTPSLFELYHTKDLSPERTFVLEHNYMFDYNFYLSRIRQGQEGRLLVVEKYYHKPHTGSLLQIFYLYIGKIGGFFGLSPAVIYHAMRLILGFVLLLLIGWYVSLLFPGKWQLVAYLLIVTSGSWPILVKAGTFWRFATHMGWWSAIDSLQRITFIPHVVLGQIFILVFIWQFGRERDKSLKTFKLLIWGVVGFLVGIVFPPLLVVVYTVFAVLSFLEISSIIFRTVSLKEFEIKVWLGERVLPRVVFILFTFPALIYLQLMFKILPWSALALFDIQHRIILPYTEYALALGPVLPLGLAGLVLAFVQAEKKLFPSIAWVASIGLLFLVFEHIPQQSPSRFTEAVINIPLGILATYFLFWLWQFNRKYTRSLIFVMRGLIGISITTVILMGLGVMVSMVLWLTDQATSKRIGSWIVPTGTQLIYPLKDFMEGIYYLRDSTSKNEIVFAYETAGNFIPAYAGNFVYLGHANTPEADRKLTIAAKFFSGKMSQIEAKTFLKNERISYIFFGPQEKDFGKGKIVSLSDIYPFVSRIYENSKVMIYKVKV